MDYTHNTFPLDELARLKSFMEHNKDETITFEDKIRDWPRADVLNLLEKYKNPKLREPVITLAEVMKRSGYKPLDPIQMRDIAARMTKARE